jgi:hypothetical protein
VSQSHFLNDGEQAFGALAILALVVAHFLRYLRSRYSVMADKSVATLLSKLCSP